MLKTRTINELIELENKNISYEVRFYCDECDIEIDQDDQQEHIHKRKMSYEEKCKRYGWNPKGDEHV